MGTIRRIDRISDAADASVDIERLAETTTTVGPYSRVRGHHIHQSGSYGTGLARTANPNHKSGLSIEHGPGFTRQQHRLADAVQRNLNRGVRGRTVRRPQIGPSGEQPRVTIQATGDGVRSPTANPYLEDVKAYYSLRAARPQGFETPDRVLDLVRQSSDQLQQSGTVPLRVPTR